LELEEMFLHGDEIFSFSHDSIVRLPKYMEEIDWDLIVLGPTFLCHRYAEKSYEKARQRFDWISQSPAIKVAFPQDEYDCSYILDNWMSEINIDILVSVCPEWKNLFYPTYSKLGKIWSGYTNYITDSMCEEFELNTQKTRKLDVSYRASKLPANFGRVGKLKTEIGDIFAESVREYNLKLDISTDPKKFKRGLEWRHFIEDSKSVLVTPSGSSIFDPWGNIRKNVKNHLKKYPLDKFEQIESACFPEQDNLYEITAISPRCVEAALLGAAQIATPGHYSGVFDLETDLIRLNQDCSNHREVVDKILDEPYRKKVAINAYEAIISRTDLRMSTMKTKIYGYVTQNRRVTDPSTQDVNRGMKYKIESVPRIKLAWKIQESKNSFVKTIQLGRSLNISLKEKIKK
jgi:hypothetical protein